jgi:DNA polymerase III subunit delta
LGVLCEESSKELLLFFSIYIFLIDRVGNAHSLKSMSILLYWGEDEFALNQAIKDLQQQTVTAAWMSFNYQKIGGDKADGAIEALNQAMTPPFGAGQRLVWLADTTMFAQSNESLLAELERTIPAIPDSSVLLITCTNKPDGRSKITKFIQKHAQIKEFALVSAWKGAEIEQQVRQTAQELKVKLTPEAIELLAISVGNNTRQLHTELTKLSLYSADRSQPLSADEVGSLVAITTQNSLQLAEALRQGEIDRALDLINALVQRNEPALKIVATLVGQFRTWLWVKALIEAGEQDEVIAKEADIGNPKRLYFLRKDLQKISARKLVAAFQELLVLEFALKQGNDPIMALQTQAMKICQVIQ